MKNLVLKFSQAAREKRAATFRAHFDFDRHTKILDIGSEDGANIRQVLASTNVAPENVFIADIDKDLLERGAANFGFQPVLLGETENLSFADKFFDIVYCSSVIEHVTVPKDEIWTLTDGAEFEKKSFARQKVFAAEIRRLGKQYFVQTPNKNFLVESHTWLPLINFLPRPFLIKSIAATNKFWIKKAIPDFNLLGARAMSELFPGAQIVAERKFGLTKSIMAIKSLR